MKEKGILLPIFSLPSKYGIGDFGYEAYEFIDILSENNIKYWEILPINACDQLPYSPESYYALDENVRVIPVAETQDDFFGMPLWKRLWKIRRIIRREAPQTLISFLPKLQRSFDI